MSSPRRSGRPTPPADLLDRLSISGAALLETTLDGIADGTLSPVPQPSDGVTVAPKVTVDDARVRWDLPAHVVERRIRAVTPNPGAWTLVGELTDQARAGDGRRCGSETRCRQAQFEQTAAASGSERRRKPVLLRHGSAAGQEADGRGGMGARCPARRIRNGVMTKPRRPRRKPLDPARQAAFDVLRAVSERDAYANLVLPALLRERGITGRDAAFATELAYGTCRDPSGCSTPSSPRPPGRPPDRISPVLLDLLRLGTYQLLRTRVDAHAAVSTTVEQAGNRIRFDASGFRQRRAAHHRLARDRSSGSTSWPRLSSPIPSATWRSCTPIRAGSPRRSRTRSAPEQASWTRC